MTRSAPWPTTTTARSSSRSAGRRGRRAPSPGRTAGAAAWAGWSACASPRPPRGSPPTAADPSCDRSTRSPQHHHGASCVGRGQAVTCPLRPGRRRRGLGRWGREQAYRRCGPGGLRRRGPPSRALGAGGPSASWRQGHASDPTTHGVRGSRRMATGATTPQAPGARAQRRRRRHAEGPRRAALAEV